MDQKSQVIVTPDRYGLSDLVREVWHRRWAASGIVVTFALLGVIYGAVMPKEYTASVVIAPVLGKQSAGGMGGLSSGSRALSGLAGLAGLSLPGREENNEAIAVLQSELVTQNYIRQNGLLQILYASNWNAKTNAWTTTARDHVPTLWMANQLFRNNIRRVTEDTKSGLYVMNIRWKDPVLAARWANGLVSMTNDYLRQQAIQEADRDIKYLNDQAERATALGVKSVLYALLESEIDKEMVAKGEQEYALKVIDPAFVPERPSTHGPLLWGILGAFLGVVVALSLAFIRGVFSTVSS